MLAVFVCWPVGAGQKWYVSNSSVGWLKRLDKRNYFWTKYLNMKLIQKRCSTGLKTIHSSNSKATEKKTKNNQDKRKRKIMSILYEGMMYPTETVYGAFFNKATQCRRHISAAHPRLVNQMLVLKILLIMTESIFFFFFFRMNYCFHVLMRDRTVWFTIC